MLPSETMIWQPEFTSRTLSRKPGAVHRKQHTPEFRNEALKLAERIGVAAAARELSLYCMNPSFMPGAVNSSNK